MTAGTWCIRDLLKVTAEYLREKGTEAPRLCAELLLAHQLKTGRIDLYLNFDKPLSGAELEGYRSLIRRRVGGEPLQYITGRQEFWSLEFEVGSGVLIPRPESELLVEQSISLLRKEESPDPEGPRILDLGTGCGCLILALARELQKARLFACDMSSEALVFARRNARRWDPAGRISFFQGDFFAPLKEEIFPFDLIVTNPPYVPTQVLDTLRPEVRRHEPHLALEGGPEGLGCIRRIIREAPGFLRPRGWLLLEMDPDQTETALDWMDRSGQFEQNYRIRDYSQRYRVVGGRRKT